MILCVCLCICIIVAEKKTNKKERTHREMNFRLNSAECAQLRCRFKEGLFSNGFILRASIGNDKSVCFTK